MISLKGATKEGKKMDYLLFFLLVLSLFFSRFFSRPLTKKMLYNVFKDIFFLSLFSLITQIFFSKNAIVSATIFFLVLILVYIDLQFEKIYERGIERHDFLWCNKALWHNFSSVIYEVGFTGCFQFLLLFISLLVLYFHPLPPLLNLIGIFFGLIAFLKNPDHPIVRLILPNKGTMQHPNKKIPFKTLLCSLESSVFLNPEYPFLRKTISYKGSPLFELKKSGKPNVVVVFLESLGMRDLEYAPFFLNLKKGGVFFEQFYANYPVSTPATISTLFGILPLYKGLCLKKMGKTPYKGMPEIFKELGYRTLNITSNFTNAKKEYLDDPYAFDYYASRADYIRGIKEEFYSSYMVDDRLAYRDLIDQMDAGISNQKPIFGIISNGFGHHPWIVPASEDSKPNEPIKRLRQSLKIADQRLAEFFKEAETKPWFENTLFILMGDHGQPMGEHENRQIRRGVYQENVHIPLLIYKKGDLGPQSIPFVGSQVDILPTLIDLLKIPCLHHSIGFPLSRQKPGRHVLLGNIDISKNLGWIEWPYKYTTEGLFNLALDPNEELNLQSELKELSDAFEKKTLEAFSVIDFCNTHETWTPRVHETIVVDTKKGGETLLKELERKTTPKRLEISGQLSSDSPIILFFKKFSTLESIKITDCLLPVEYFTSLFQSNAFKEIIFHSVYGCTPVFGPFFRKNQLRKLHLSSIDITTEVLTSFLLDQPIVDLKISNIELDPDPLIKAISKKNLKNLELDLPISDAHLQLILQSNTLETLRIQNGSNLTKKGFELLNNQKLNHVQFRQLDFWEDSLLQTLKSIPLISFSIQSAAIEDKHLIQFLELCLDEVHIFDCPKISEEVLVEFSRRSTGYFQISYAIRIFFNTEHYQLASYKKSGEFILEKKPFCVNITPYSNKVEYGNLI